MLHFQALSQQSVEYERKSQEYYGAVVAQIDAQVKQAKATLEAEMDFEYGSLHEEAQIYYGLLMHRMLQERIGKQVGFDEKAFLLFSREVDRDMKKIARDIEESIRSRQQLGVAPGKTALESTIKNLEVRRGI